MLLSYFRYGMFGRIIPSDAGIALAVIKIIAQFGWSRIAVIYTDDAYGRGYAQDMATFATTSGIEIATAQKFTGGR